MADPSVLFLDQSGGLGGAELCLLDYLRRRRGPAEVVVFADGPFVSALRDAGVSTRLLAFDPAVTKTSGALRQLFAAPRLAAFSRRIAKIAKAHDVMYANTQKAAIVGAAAAWMSRRPLIWHLHDILDSDHFSCANRMAVIAATNLVRCHVIANSQATAEAYRRAGGRHEATVIYNGIDVERFGESAGFDREQIRLGIGVDSDQRLIGVFGRLTPWKGQHVLLDALQSDALRKVAAAFVGEALYTNEDRAYADRLRQMSADPGLASRVHWLGHRNDIPELMQACDVVVHCSTQPEPLGRVIIEGMLAGRPVVAAAAGGALEIINDGVDGLLTPPGDSDRLAAAIGSLLIDPEFAKRLAEAGRASARDRFRLEDRAQDVDEVLARIIQ